MIQNLFFSGVMLLLMVACTKSEVTDNSKTQSWNPRAKTYTTFAELRDYYEDSTGFTAMFAAVTLNPYDPADTVIEAAAILEIQGITVSADDTTMLSWYIDLDEHDGDLVGKAYQNYKRTCHGVNCSRCELKNKYWDFAHCDCSKVSNPDGPAWQCNMNSGIVISMDITLPNQEQVFYDGWE